MLAFAAHREDVGLGKDLKMVRDGRLRDVKTLGNLATRQFADGCDLLHHAKPALICESLKHA